MALATEHLKKNRDSNQQNSNRTHIVNPSTSEEEGRPPLFEPAAAHISQLSTL